MNLFKRKKRKPESLKQEESQEETLSITLTTDDSLRKRCETAWRAMGFVNDRLDQIQRMEHVFEIYEKLDKELAAKFKPTHLHKKGRYYQVIGEGINEATATPVVIYKNDMGITWVRPSEEFYDGRFTPIEEIENDD